MANKNIFSIFENLDSTENGETNSNTLKKNNVFDFISNPEKLKALNKANEILNINKNSQNKLVLVYSGPKVGSTSVVSSLRVFGIDKLNIIHIHDETMLKVLTNIDIDKISINEIILFNKYLGKDIYVINIYRTPIERKISAFFEKIGSYHFNNKDENLNNYNILKIINRFDNIFPYLATGDHFIDKYNIPLPTNFDYNKKYLLIVDNGIKYISLRLKDSEQWSPILTKIFNFNIKVIKDYESTNKPIKNIYNKFKETYKIPKNFLDEIINDKYLKFYYSQEEINNYYNLWNSKCGPNKEHYNLEQYKLYESLTIENSHIDYVQYDHYFDEGCICKACNLKRFETAKKIMKGILNPDRVIHTEAKIELIHKRVQRATRINHMINQIPKKPRGKDFNTEMTNIVKGKKF
jgi:hypothetical protein